MARTAAGFVPFVLLCCLAAHAHTVEGDTNDESNIVILDAGSSGTRIHVYTYSRANVLESLNEVAAKKTTPGLSSFAHNPSFVRQPLTELVSYALTIIPETFHSETPLFLRATAGFRILPQEQQDVLIAAVREVLSKTPLHFKPEWASVISGEQEGHYDFITANLLFHRKQGGEFGNGGAVDMGGASIQLTFPHKEGDGIAEGLEKLDVVGKSVEFFRNSVNWYGLNEAFRKLYQARLANINPCLYKGVNGKDTQASFSDCRQAVSEVVTSAVFKEWPPITKYCGPFYLYDHFSTFLGMTLEGGPFARGRHRVEATRICGLDYDALQVKFPDVDKLKLEKSCFGFAYVDVLLTHILENSGSSCIDESGFYYENPVKGTHIGDVSWAPGAALQEASKRTGILPL